MPALGLPEERSNGEYFLCFFGLNSVAEGEMQYVSFVPLEPRDSHGLK